MNPGQARGEIQVPNPEEQNTSQETENINPEVKVAPELEVENPPEVNTKKVNEASGQPEIRPETEAVLPIEKISEPDIAGDLNTPDQAAMLQEQLNSSVK